MSAETVKRDERTVVVENASFRWAYNIMLYGVTFVVVYRSLLWKQICWDLVGLVILSGLVAMVYQGAHEALPCRHWRAALIAAVVLAVAGAVMAYLRGGR